jgi:hypothetical protein
LQRGCESRPRTCAGCRKRFEKRPPRGDHFRVPVIRAHQPFLPPSSLSPARTISTCSKVL